MKKLLILSLCILCVFGCAYNPSVPETAPASAQTVETPAPTQEAAAEVVLSTPTPTPELPTLPPTPSPTPEPTPAPTSEPTPTPEPTKDPNRKMVALTFDDGPNNTITVPVLEKLEQYHVKATFFVLGSAINDQNGYMLQMMVDGGHEIGIHGLNHNNMTQFSAERNTQRLLAASEEISGWIEGGYQPRIIRPPKGKRDGKVLRGAKDAGMAVILWSVDTRDWESKNVDKIMEIVKKQTKDGSIILCHDHHKPTLDALDEMIPWLLEQGYELVTVSELLDSQPGGMQPGVVYSCKTTGN